MFVTDNVHDGSVTNVVCFERTPCPAVELLELNIPILDTATLLPQWTLKN